MEIEVQTIRGRPVKTVEFRLFGKRAELRLFREEGDRDSYYLTVLFPEVADVNNDDFALEREGEPFAMESPPQIEGPGVEISWKIKGGMDQPRDALLTLRVRMKRTPVDSEMTFWVSDLLPLDFGVDAFRKPGPVDE